MYTRVHKRLYVYIQQYVEVRVSLSAFSCLRRCRRRVSLLLTRFNPNERTREPVVLAVSSSRVRIPRKTERPPEPFRSLLISPGNFNGGETAYAYMYTVRALRRLLTNPNRITYRYVTLLPRKSFPKFTDTSIERDDKYFQEFY